jgi:hypothetical protein
MTLARLIPLDMHGALEAALGALMIVAPFALGFEPAGMVVAVATGALLVSVALASHADSTVIPVSSHVAFDSFFTAAMAVGAAGFAFAGDVAAAVSFAVSALAFALLGSLTRYSEPAS